MALPRGVGAGVVMLHGDCLELLPSVADGSVDMVFADLPYGVTANKWDSVIPFEPLWEQLLRVGKKNAAFVFAATQPFTTVLVTSQPKLFKYPLVWDKVRAGRWMHAKNMPLARHEDVLVFYRAKPSYNPQMVLRDKPQKVGGLGVQSVSYNGNKNRDTLAGKTYTHKFPDTLLTFAKESGMHPTQKPVALMEWLVKTYTNPGDTVLDPTMGSGTTGVACHNTGRKFIGIEKDATYFATAQKRMENAQNESQLRLLLDISQPRTNRPRSESNSNGVPDECSVG